MMHNSIDILKRERLKPGGNLVGKDMVIAVEAFETCCGESR